MKSISSFIIVGILALMLGACDARHVGAQTAEDIHFYDHEFAASPNDCYYALRWALKISGYSLAKENLKEGILTTTWMPTTSDSHYMSVFAHRDYGVNGGYHQIEVRVVPQGDKTLVEVGSRVKSVTPNLVSSGVEEQRVLAEVGNYLRSEEPNISNEGIVE